MRWDETIKHSNGSMAVGVCSLGTCTFSEGRVALWVLMLGLHPVSSGTGSWLPVPYLPLPMFAYLGWDTVLVDVTMDVLGCLRCLAYISAAEYIYLRVHKICLLDCLCIFLTGLFLYQSSRHAWALMWEPGHAPAGPFFLDHVNHFISVSYYIAWARSGDSFMNCIPAVQYFCDAGSSAKEYRLIAGEMH